MQRPQVASQRTGTVTQNMELDSDKEYDNVTRRVWEKGLDHKVLRSKLVKAKKRCMVEFHGRRISLSNSPLQPKIEKQLLLPKVIKTLILIKILRVLEQLSRAIHVH